MTCFGGTGWRRTLRGIEGLEPRLMFAAQPIITEFMASNSATFEDGFGDNSDWVEIYNAGDAPVDLQGHHLTDSLSNLTKWTFATSTILNPNQSLIVFASDRNTIDPLGYHHTNYKLAAEGEDIALVAPDLTVLSQHGPGGADFPPQLTDISYGVSGPTLVNGNSPSRYLVPSNGNLGLTWTETNFEAASGGFSSGKAAVGYDTTTTPINYANYFKTPVPTNTTSVYVRSEFNLPNAAAVTSLNLNLKYDDAVVVYLNGHKIASTEFAPASPQWNSLATGSRADASVVAGNDFPLTPYLEFLQTGKNVLAIHLLNQSGSSDLLVDPVLTADYGTSAIGYLATPTPGSANSGLINIGPIIDAVNFSPDNPAENQAIIVTAHVTSFAAPVDPTSVRLVYRVMYGSEVQLTMVDDGTSGDAIAGDEIYAAVIPDSAFGPGQLVRWYVTAVDTTGTTSRAPTFLDPLDSPEYYGTVAIDPTITTDLPVFHWFVQNPDAADTQAGTRASLYMLGQFYDNIRVEIHGQSTAQPAFLKKSYDFDANSGLKFQVDTGFGRVSDFNLLTNYTDKTYLRNTLAYEVYTEAGGPGLYAFSAVVHRNGSYYGLYDVVEEGDEEFLERVGLDPDGALYKLNNGFDSSTVNVEKKTREYEGNADLQQLVNTASLSAQQGEKWVYDNLDIASWVNYFAVQTLIANRDYGQKNYYLYNDSNDTKLWSLIPWDVDLSFGHQWNVSENYFDDDLIFNDGFYVYQGGNHLIERLRSMTKFNDMYRRRLRTLMDEFYGAPGGSIEDSYVADRFDQLISEMGAEALLDRNTWGVPAGMAFETPTQAIARVKQNFLAARKQFLQTLFGVPPSQVATPTLTFGTIDYNPTTGNQAQEYIAIVNGTNDAIDISGWTISGAVSHTFAGGTVIPRNSTYYVVADVAAFKLRPSGPSGGQLLHFQGNYDGQLNNNFGELVLRNTTGAARATASYGTPPLAGDYDLSGTVDNLDYDVWMSTFGSTVDLRADGNGDNIVDSADYAIWRHHFGASSSAGNSAMALGGSKASLQTVAAEFSTDSVVASEPSRASDRPTALSAFEQKSDHRLRSRDSVLGNGILQTWTSIREIDLLVALANADSVIDSPGADDDLVEDKAQQAATIDCAIEDLYTFLLPPLRPMAQN